MITKSRAIRDALTHFLTNLVLGQFIEPVNYNYGTSFHFWDKKEYRNVPLPLIFCPAYLQAERSILDLFACKCDSFLLTFQTDSL